MRLGGPRFPQEQLKGFDLAGQEVDPAHRTLLKPAKLGHSRLFLKSIGSIGRISNPTLRSTEESIALPAQSSTTKGGSP